MVMAKIAVKAGMSVFMNRWREAQRVDTRIARDGNPFYREIYLFFIARSEIALR